MRKSENSRKLANSLVGVYSSKELKEASGTRITQILRMNTDKRIQCGAAIIWIAAYSGLQVFLPRNVCISKSFCIFAANPGYFTSKNPSGIATLPASDQAECTVYDLSGRKLSSNPTQRGIYIVNGEKVIRR